MSLVDRLIARAKRTPYFNLEGYMERYWLLKPNGMKDEGEPKRKLLPDLGIRIHRILRSDTDRHLHDHPWGSMSIVLCGGYLEVMPLDPNQDPALDETQTIAVWRKPGAIVFRKAHSRHRLVLPEGKDCWSMFWTGPYRKGWGFYTAQGFVPWRKYLGME